MLFSTLYIKKSNIQHKDAGNGLFVNFNVKPNTELVVYYGEKINMDDLYDIYIKNKDKYFEINKYIRGTPHNYVICGDLYETRTKFLGVYVNDIGSITCTKKDLTLDILKKYAKTINKCNVRVDDSGEYPIYISVKTIKKGEELYAHYGIGYWLSYIGFLPEEISDLNKKYNFSCLY